MKKIEKSGQKKTFDSFLSNLTLEKNLPKEKLTLIRTLRKNKLELHLNNSGKQWRAVTSEAGHAIGTVCLFIACIAVQTKKFWGQRSFAQIMLHLPKS